MSELDMEGAAALMRMNEVEIDAELRSMGIDPNEAARMGEQAVREGMERAQRGVVTCPLCGKVGPHQHTPEEMVIFRNGMKRGAAPDAPLTTPIADDSAEGLR